MHAYAENGEERQKGRREAVAAGEERRSPAGEREAYGIAIFLSRPLSPSRAHSTQRTSQAKLSPCAVLACFRAPPVSLMGFPAGGLASLMCFAWLVRAPARLYYRLCLSPSLCGCVAVRLARRRRERERERDRWWMRTRPTRGGGGCGSQLVARRSR